MIFGNDIVDCFIMYSEHFYQGSEMAVSSNDGKVRVCLLL
jgi:hypothetical protein